MSLYHFTDTARLPFILQSGTLKPGRNKIGGFPDPDFLWATTQAVGDYTASGTQAYRSGQTRLVRFTLQRKHFRPWPEITTDYPQWTPTHIERLEHAARELSNPADWFCRAEPLALSEVLEIETRSWRSGWVPLESRKVVRIEGMPGALAVTAAGRVFISRQVEIQNGTVAYEFWSAPAADLRGNQAA